VNKKKHNKNKDLPGKILLSLNPDLIARGKALIAFQARSSLTGSASLSSVLRQCIADGLDIMEKESIEAE